VVPAFEMLKRCGKKRNDKEFKFSDEEIAAMVRVLVVWKASAEIASLGANIKRLSKDAKKNAEAIDKANNDIKIEQELMNYVTNPSYDLADNFIAAYNNKENEMHSSAVEIYKSIVETYYKDVTVPELEFETMLLNVQQHVGIDLNLFNEEMLKRDEYDSKNLIEITSEKSEKSEEKKEEGKNA
jgi:predicted nucleic acid-binding protein